MELSPRLVGIVNITADSFSDGGLYLEPAKALAHARRLSTQGAALVELGAASSSPDASPVSPTEEIARLGPVLDVLLAEGRSVAIDTSQPEVQRFAVARGVEMLNDIRGFPDSEVYESLASASCLLVVMHSITGAHQAIRAQTEPHAVFDSMCEFFRGRLDRLAAAGISPDRLIVDPGMGYFLGSNPETSLFVLTRLAELRRLFGHPVLVSVSRKSFLRNLAPDDDCDLGSRTLAAELHAVTQGAAYIRTHDVRALAQALRTVKALSDAALL